MKKILITCIVFFGFGFSFLWIVGGKLSSPAFAQAGLPPSQHTVENVEYEDVHGWYFPSKHHKACILLLHGVRSNRREMLGRAIFLKEEGYSSFTIDLQGHGETPGEGITFGYRESESAQSAVEYLRTKKYCTKVVTIGSSLGGAATLLGHSPIDVDGYILEAVYPSIEVAIERRLEIRLGAVGKILAPLLYLQIPFRLGIDLDALQPSASIRNIKAPVLIMNGTEDQRTTIGDARQMYINAPSPKEFVEFGGATHTNLYKYSPNEYKNTVLGFLSKYVDERT